VPVQQANDLHKALKKAGVTEKLVVYEGSGHGLSREHATKAILEMITFLNQHVKDAKAGKPEVEVLSDVEYGKGGDVSLKMRVLRPKTLPKQPMPVLVWIHGGGWEDGTPKESGDRHLMRFAQRGYLCATIDYRLSGKAIFPAQIEDCKCAIRFLRSQAKAYHLDPDRIGVWGESAGGHLAALLGTSGGVTELEGSGGHAEFSSRVQAVCDWYGPSDLVAAFVGDPKPTSVSARVYVKIPF
jgi:acetyl esterase/lipase